ncbi:tlde1 domain-containing protein [Arvimicrobium flavum]|uniref:tlde1 domain-containing protein n=1 Tax=Arvimicrobium flavum TaxID=3393320 RepID=UPI00237AD3D0|nr:tlde1 domain-containing protein [Mesorhizobium shangrilense]
MSRRTAQPVARGNANSGIVRVTRKLAAASAGIAFALWGAAVMLNLPSNGLTSPTVATASAAYVHPIFAEPNPASQAKPTEKAARRRPAISGKSERAARLPGDTASDQADAARPPAGAKSKSRHWSEIFTQRNVAFVADPTLKARFERVSLENPRAREKLAVVLQAAEAAEPRATQAAVAAAPGGQMAERFAPVPPATPSLPVLAYADPSPAGQTGALATMPAATAVDEAARAAEDNEENDADGTALSPDYDDTPEATPVPLARPRTDDDVRPDPRASVPDRSVAQKPAARPREDVVEEKLKREAQPARRAESKVAYARPDDPSDKPSGGLFRNLFGPRAGSGVAVYDISAAKVYMPDGSVLEAHSGIGKMADNPRYAHVKMNGPTPPHTYNLKMREKRFHGVEAIRMLPVDGRNKHGRDGFLTHSYLLRGGRAESHGCVAFKNYDKFLNAFKKGKVRQLVVVPGGGKPAIQVAKNGRDA